MSGVELVHARERVEVVGLPTEKAPGAVGAVATITLVVAVLVPFAFVAVRVKTVEVESAGVPVLVPMTVPIAGLIDSEVAPVSVQLKVEVPFGATVCGEAEKEAIVGGKGLVDEVSFPTA